MSIVGIPIINILLDKRHKLHNKWDGCGWWNVQLQSWCPRRRLYGWEQTCVLLNQSINCETDNQVTRTVFIKEAYVILDPLQFFAWYSFLTTNSNLFCHWPRKSKDSKFNKTIQSEA